ncbi:MAG: portal protein, partial [bacterium]
IGGNSSAFRELDDLYYFHKKLYRALKYPISRVEKHHEGQSDDVLFRGRSIGEITRDEIK